MTVCQTFSQESCNVINDAIAVAAGANMDDFYCEANKGVIYDFLEKTPIASLVAELDDAIKSLGYKIVKE